MIHTAEEALLWKKLSNLFLVTGIATALLGIAATPFFFWSTAPLLGAWGYSRKMLYRWERGFEGEYRVIEALSEAKGLDGVLLSDLVLPGRKANIDHALICERGIFAIETKAYSGVYFVSGGRWYVETPSGRKDVKSISKVAKRNAALLSGFLRENLGKGYFVRPLIVFAGDGLVVGESTVPVLSPEELVGYIGSLPKGLSKRDITLLGEFLEEYSSHVMVMP